MAKGVVETRTALIWMRRLRFLVLMLFVIKRVCCSNCWFSDRLYAKSGVTKFPVNATLAALLGTM